MTLYTKITFDPPATKYGRKLPEVTREGHRRIMLFWHRKYVKRHFNVGARSRYGYKPRSKKYLWRKGQLIKAVASGIVALNSRHDMVLTGLTRDKALGRPHVKAWPTRAKLTMFTPSYVKMKPNLSKRNAPNLGQELTRTIPEEKREMDRELERVVIKGLRNIRGKYTVIITG